ncbi:hypothetical protein E2320_014443, partial [Naja naja]
DLRSGEGRNLQQQQQLTRFSPVASLLPGRGGNRTARLAPGLSSHLLPPTHLPDAASILGRAQKLLCTPPFAHDTSGLQFGEGSNLLQEQQLICFSLDASLLPHHRRNQTIQLASGLSYDLTQLTFQLLLRSWEENNSNLALTTFHS